MYKIGREGSVTRKCKRQKIPHCYEEKAAATAATTTVADSIWVTRRAKITNAELSEHG